MTGTIHAGYEISSLLNHPNWGDGYTEAEREILTCSQIEEFDRLAALATGDRTIFYCAATSEIVYTVSEGQAEVDFRDIAAQAAEFMAANIERIIGD